jgi:hypothetical protein
MIRTSGCLLLVGALLLVPRTETPSAEQAPMPREVGKRPAAGAPESSGPKMPLTNLAPARPMFDACLYKYPVSTTTAQCQAYVNQGLGMYYSYVWIEAARAFETALQHDPECAYAWLMLSRSLEKWGRAGPVVRPEAFVAVLGGAVYGKLPDRAGKNTADYALTTIAILIQSGCSRNSRPSWMPKT